MLIFHFSDDTAMEMIQSNSYSIEIKCPQCVHQIQAREIAGGVEYEYEIPNASNGKKKKRCGLDGPDGKVECDCCKRRIASGIYIN